MLARLFFGLTLGVLLAEAGALTAVTLVHHLFTVGASYQVFVWAGLAGAAGGLAWILLARPQTPKPTS
jgi:ABC-type transport system involved in cytochrome c biogenesis permease subunit